MNLPKIKPTLVFSVLFLFSCGNAESTGPRYSPTSPDYLYEEEDFNAYPGNDVTVIDPEEVEMPENSIHTRLQQAYLLSGITTTTSFARGVEELSKPMPITFKANDQKEGTHYFEIAKNKDFKNSEFFESDSSSVEVYNLEIGTEYFYRYATSRNGLGNAKVETLTTDSRGPRNLDIDGITNVRDIGGYPSKLGGRIRQGLYYRGGRLNTSSVDEVQIELTEKGRKELVGRLGVKNEIDLRMDETCDSEQNEYGYMEDGLIEGLTYNHFPIDWHISNQMLGATEIIRDIFTFLGEEENYPVYLHCNIGTDRTGLISFLLETLIGMPVENVYRDYLFSNFGNIGDSRDYKKLKSAYYNVLKGEEGLNLHMMTYNYLLSCGVEEESLDTIIELFVETPLVEIPDNS